MIASSRVFSPSCLVATQCAFFLLYSLLVGLFVAPQKAHFDFCSPTRSLVLHRPGGKCPRLLLCLNLEQTWLSTEGQGGALYVAVCSCFGFGACFQVGQ